MNLLDEPHKGIYKTPVWRAKEFQSTNQFIVPLNIWNAWNCFVNCLSYEISQHFVSLQHAACWNRTFHSRSWGEPWQCLWWLGQCGSPKRTFGESTQHPGQTDTIGWNIWFSCSFVQMLERFCSTNRTLEDCSGWEICRTTKFFFWPLIHKITARAGNQDTSNEV